MTTYLFPNSVKPWAWLILILGVIGGILATAFEFEPELFEMKVLSLYSTDDFFVQNNGFFKWMEQNIFDDICGVFIIIGGVLLGFSREKIEDEFIMQLRLSSLALAVYVNYGILLLAFLLIHGLDFFTVMIYNMFTLLLIFILIFQIKLKTAKDGR
ncbi:hypothetical protein [Mesohalobacter halotolerans]|uniref:Uncharacterized protein n=1 Tax=Mesohalobacter halotolerans TaxID=1883405 RepID=A0A4U5TT78_9FLAO|nr:hypothetical protein [Mesohalobacter halotolerans]TKS57051.1 hypothetical protein FCN74_01115 [Mesohalobacter halotolerans]